MRTCKRYAYAEADAIFRLQVCYLKIAFPQVLNVFQSEDGASYCRKALKEERGRKAASTDLIGYVPFALRCARFSQLIGQFPIADVPALQLWRLSRTNSRIASLLSGCIRTF
jgi:hypothetical protein